MAVRIVVSEPVAARDSSGLTEMTFERTIDWDAFWRESGEHERERASPGAEHAPELLPAFFEEKGVPESFADVGCGSGAVVFELARRYPETTIVGYDAAGSVLEANRERALGASVPGSEGDDPLDEDAFENVRFERTILPTFEPGREFEVVFSCCTLCYVPETERALRNLYEAVAPGGYLVLGYVSELGRRHFEERFGDLTPGSTLGRFDPVERFELVLEGESVLSYRRIHRVLGTWPRSFWSVVEKPEGRWAWRNAPLVWVPK
ncbi:MAG: class I SAM-dependent methyltransferase [Halalkalicoccus sp.]